MTEIRRERLPSAPKHLSKESARLWRSVNAEYRLEDHHKAILEATLEARGRKQQAARDLEANGSLYITDGNGKPAPHPGVAIERDSRLAELRGWDQLKLDREPVGAMGRPPIIQPLGGRRTG